MTTSAFTTVGGRLVYSSIDFRNGWDGTVNGSPAATGTYVWILQGKDLGGQTVARKGTVTLLR